MELRWHIKKLLRRVGYDIVPFAAENYPDLKRRMQLIDHFGIDVLLDVGANQGQYATTMRKLGFTGKIVSFEPLSTVFAKLKEHARDDPNWKAVNLALGSGNETATLNIANKSQASSIREMLPELKKMTPHMAYAGTEEIKVRTLDSILHHYVNEEDTIYLKIDTQGYEKNVIDGALDSMSKIVGIQMELSLVELYSGEILFADMIHFMQKYGYVIMSLEPGFFDKSTGQLLQTDVVFFRNSP